MSVTKVSPETYYYAPIANYDGKVLKCEGLVSEENRAWMPNKHPGVIELVGYRGDRIHAESHADFNG